MTNETPEKLDLRSHTIAEDKKQELLQLFRKSEPKAGRLTLNGSSWLLVKQSMLGANASA